MQMHILLFSVGLLIPHPIFNYVTYLLLFTLIHLLTKWAGDPELPRISSTVISVSADPISPCCNFSKQILALFLWDSLLSPHDRWFDNCKCSGTSYSLVTSLLKSTRHSTLLIPSCPLCGLTWVSLNQLLVSQDIFPLSLDLCSSIDDIGGWLPLTPSCTN